MPFPVAGPRRGERGFVAVAKPRQLVVGSGAALELRSMTMLLANDGPIWWWFFRGAREGSLQMHAELQ